MSELPPFASGKIAGDYTILFEYWRVAREMSREDLIEASMLHEPDYDLLRRSIRIGESVFDLLERLTVEFEKRVDPNVAFHALERLEIHVPREEAGRLVAKLIASWLIEAGEYWGILRVKG